MGLLSDNVLQTFEKNVTSFIENFELANNKKVSNADEDKPSGSKTAVKTTSNVQESNTRPEKNKRKASTRQTTNCAKKVKQMPEDALSLQ